MMDSLFPTLMIAEEYNSLMLTELTSSDTFKFTVWMLLNTVRDSNSISAVEKKIVSP